MVVVGGGGAKGKKTHKDDSFLYVFARGNVCLLLGVMWFKSQKQERDAGAGGGGSYMCSVFNYYYYYYFVIGCKRLADVRFLFTL